MPTADATADATAAPDALTAVLTLAVVNAVYSCSSRSRLSIGASWHIAARL